MLLHDKTVFMKLTTDVDILDDGTFLTMIDGLESMSGQPFGTFVDLAIPRAPELALSADRAALLDAHVGAGFHQTARFRLSADGVARSIEVHAGLHPYSGAYVVQIHARLDDRFANENAEAVADELARWIDRTDALCAFAHDTDDDAMQNIDNPRLLELGYGVSQSCAVEARPGREVSFGQFRFAPSWLTWIGSHGLERLGVSSVIDAGADVDSPSVNAKGALFRLAATPDEARGDAIRPAQTRLRAKLRLDEAQAAERRSFSYWKRKP